MTGPERREFVPANGLSPTAAKRRLTSARTDILGAGAAAGSSAAAVTTATSSVGAADSADAADIVLVIAFAVVPLSAFCSVAAASCFSCTAVFRMIG